MTSIVARSEAHLAEVIWHFEDKRKYVSHLLIEDGVVTLLHKVDPSLKPRSIRDRNAMNTAQLCELIWEATSGKASQHDVVVTDHNTSRANDEFVVCEVRRHVVQ